MCVWLCYILRRRPAVRLRTLRTAHLAKDLLVIIYIHIHIHTHIHIYIYIYILPEEQSVAAASSREEAHTPGRVRSAPRRIARRAWWRVPCLKAKGGVFGQGVKPSARVRWMKEARVKGALQLLNNAICKIALLRYLSEIRFQVLDSDLSAIYP